MTFELSKELRGFQYEVEAITKRDDLRTQTVCAKCKKFKKQNTNSIYCFKCLGV